MAGMFASRSAARGSLASKWTPRKMRRRQSAVDYLRCAAFINNEPSEEHPIGYRLKESGPFVPKGLRYVPFGLKPDGQMR